MPFLMIWYYRMVPASQRALLILGIDTINAGTFSIIHAAIALVIIVTSATIVGVAYYLAYRNPVEFNLSHALAVLLLALIAQAPANTPARCCASPTSSAAGCTRTACASPTSTESIMEGYLAHSMWVWWEWSSYWRALTRDCLLSPSSSMGVNQCV